MSAARPLYGLSVERMRDLMRIKRLSRMNKGELFNCFVTDNISNFLEQLKTSLPRLPNNIRFQVTVRDNDVGEVGHFYLIDFYVKDGKLNALVLDPAVSQECVYHALNQLNMNFPEGKHYCFYAEKKTSKIQADEETCAVFVREHAAKISKMDSQNLYSILEKIAKHELPALSEQSGQERFEYARAKYFTTDDLKMHPSEMKVVLPLFRSMQSITALKALPDELKNARVSSKGSGTLQEWVSAHEKTIQVIDRSGEKMTIQANTSIARREQKYTELLKTLSEAKMETFSDNSGTGFLALPEMAKLTSLLFRMSPEKILAMINSIISGLSNATTFKVAFFMGPYVADTKQTAVLAQAKQEAKELQIARARMVVRLNDVVTFFAAKIHNSGVSNVLDSHRTQNLLNETIRTLEKKTDAEMALNFGVFNLSPR
jgi:hypothetical protein